MADSQAEREELIARFLEVTNSQDEAQATSVLESYGWSLEHAVSAFMTGDFGGDAHAGRGGPDATRRRVNDSASLATAPLLRGSNQPGEDEAQEIRDDSIPSTLSTVVGFPFWLAGRALNLALKPVTILLGGEETPKDGRSAAVRFIQSFERECGNSRTPNFLQEGYREAVTAAARAHKFLFVYLHSPLHEDKDEFNSVLSSDTITDFLDSNLIAWGGSVWHPEAYSVGESLGATSYPFVALLMCKTHEVHVMARVQGKTSAESLLDRISSSMARFQDQVDTMRRRHQEREESRRLREQQDLEYREALEADRIAQEAKQAEMEKAREAEELARIQEEENLENQARLEQARKDRHSQLQSSVQDEPSPGPDASRLRLQLPSGMKLDRRFSKAEKLSAIVDYILLYFLDNEIGIERVSLSTNFPKRTYGESEMHLSLEEAGLHPQAVLFVHDLDA